MKSERSSQLISEFEAATAVEDGMTSAIGEPHPMALVRHLVRRRVRELTVIGTGLALDMLIAAGCVRKVASYYAGGGYGIPVAPAFRRAAERGDIVVWECEEGILTTALEAAAKGLPSMTCRGGVGTSLPEVNPDLLLISDPITGEPVLCVPALKPDITLLHAASADMYGNVRHCGGPGWIDLFYQRAAARTIVQVERVISNEDIRADPWATTIGGGVELVRMPYGAHPFFSRGFYLQDKPLVDAYFAASALGGAELEQFLEYYCREPATHVDYLNRIGLQRLFDLYEF
jgi:glutaconate CoA-transferase subunit A